MKKAYMLFVVCSVFLVTSTSMAYAGPHNKRGGGHHGHKSVSQAKPNNNHGMIVQKRGASRGGQKQVRMI